MSRPSNRLWYPGMPERGGVQLVRDARIERVTLSDVTDGYSTVGYAISGAQQSDSYTASSATTGLYVLLPGYPYFDSATGYWKHRNRTLTMNLFSINGTKFYLPVSLSGEGSPVSLVEFDACGT